MNRLLDINKRGRRSVVAFALLIIVTSLAVPLFGDGFGSTSNFAPPEETHAFQAPETSSAASTAYFIHQQPLKIILILVFSVLAVAIIIFRRYELRRWVLLLSVIVLGFVMGGFLSPTSAVQNVILKLGSGYLLLFLVPIVLSLVMGRVFCGYICPFGAAQELLHIRKWAIKIPPQWMSLLSRFRYALLVYLVVRVLVTGTAILQDYSPFKPLSSWGGMPLTIGITPVFALLSVFVYRPFCRTLCPLGAFLSLLSRFSFSRIRANTSCVSCNLCTRECPNGAIDGGTVDASECLLCGECTEICPTSSLCTKRRRFGKAEDREASGASAQDDHECHKSGRR